MSKSSMMMMMMMMMMMIPVISFAYGVNIETRILYNFFCVVGNSDIPV
jgi:hypothetical protein